MKLCPRCAEPYADDAGFCPFDGIALTRSTDPFVGRTLAARYRLLRQIGSGGMAVVYLARHVMIERLSAIKILRQDLGLNVAHRERFLREARAVNRINHPNIVEITDFGEDAGLVFLVMEFVEGEALHTALTRGPFEVARAVKVSLEIASALGRAHELGVIHRDLKPENVLLMPRAGEDFAKLTDFGIAKLMDAPAITFTEQRFGTPGYIAPEYIEGQPATALGDIYALGVVLYQMVTGALPFDVRLPVEFLVKAVKEKPVKPSARKADVPGELEALILRMIARRPEDRPRDAFVVHDALDEILRRMKGGVVRGIAPDGLVRGIAPDGLVRGIAPDSNEAPPTVEEVAEEHPPSSAWPKLKTAPPPPQAVRPNLAATLVDGPPSGVELSPGSWLAAELIARPPSETPERWQKTMSEFTQHIEAAQRSRGDADPGVRRARELAEGAKGLLASLEKAKASAASHQAKVDALQARGRSFRTSLGHAIDALSRDRSRELLHLEAIAALRAGIHEEMEVVRPGDARQRETLVWEAAAVEAEEARARATNADLTFQIETLERQLDAQNVELEAELADATGMLEGGLSAVRRITGELVRTMADAANCI
jgi:serine/threonine-protein kinase